MTRPSFDREGLLERLAELGVDVSADVDIEAFGNGPAMALELAALVCAGKKTATASLLWSWEHEKQTPPRPGDREVVVDWAGNLLAVLETTEVEVVSFGDVGADFARDEGEGDLSLEYWRRVHWEFFEKECAEIDRTPTESMPIVCQRFRVVYAVAETD